MIFLLDDMICDKCQAASEQPLVLVKDQWWCTRCAGYVYVVKKTKS